MQNPGFLAGLSVLSVTLLLWGCKPSDQPAADDQTSIPTSRPALAAASAPAPLAPPNKVGDAAMVHSDVPKQTQTSGLVIQEIEIGEGDSAKKGDHVYVDYTGWLANGTVFDASKPDNPIDFKLGGHTVIDGWDEGITGMKVGGKRVLTIPPSLGYGNRQKGSIPPDSTLTFEVRLARVNDRIAPPKPVATPTQPASAPATATAP